jgi:hypothetical protein
VATSHASAAAGATAAGAPYANEAATPAPRPPVRVAATITMIPSPNASTPACGLSVTAAPMAAPDHARLPQRPGPSSHRATPRTPTTSSGDRRKSRWPACQAPPAR